MDIIHEVTYVSTASLHEPDAMHHGLEVWHVQCRCGVGTQARLIADAYAGHDSHAGIGPRSRTFTADLLDS